eukprot:scpid25904/ scgid22590/ Prestin; Solute carrier family 26 member 5
MAATSRYTNIAESPTPDNTAAERPPRIELLEREPRQRQRRRRTNVSVAAPRPVYSEQTFQDGFQPVLRPRRRIPMPKENPFHPRNCKPRSLKSAVRNKVRIAKWLPKYFSSGAWRKKMPADIAAGVTVGVMNIPQGLAYAQLANVPPIYGLYTSFIPVLIYLIFGSSHHIAVGTFAVVSLMVGEVVSSLQDSSGGSVLSDNATLLDSCGFPQVTPPKGCAPTGNVTEDMLTDIAGPTAVEIAVAVTIVVGVMQIVMSFARLGVVTMFLSEPLVSGYTTGAAFHVFTSQVRSLFGIKMDSQKNPAAIIKTYIHIFSHITCTRVGALLTGLVAGIILYILKLVNPRFQKKLKFPLPAELLIIVAATIISWQFDFQGEFKVDVVDCIPTGPPSPQFSSFGRLPWKDVIGPSVPIAVVAFAIAVSVGQGFAKKHEYTIDANQELLALGLSNIVGGSFSCIVCTASLSRSAVYEAVGARTQFGSLFGVSIIVLVVFAIGHLFEPLPKAVLAAIIMVSLKGLFLQFRELRRLWGISLADASVWFVTWLATLLLGVDLGLAVGVGYSLVIVLFRTSRPYYCTLGQARGTDIYRDTKIYSDIVDIPGVRVFRFEASLYFANIQYFLECLHHSVNLNPATERRHLKRRATHDELLATSLPVESRPALNASAETTADEERTGQVPALAYQSTLHAIVRTCEEIAADPDGSRQVTVDDMDSSDSESEESSTAVPVAAAPSVAYHKAAGHQSGGASPHDVEDTVNVITSPVHSTYAGRQLSSPPSSPTGIFRVETDHLICDSVDEPDLSYARSNSNRLVNDCEGIPQDDYVRMASHSNGRLSRSSAGSNIVLVDMPVRFVIIDCSPVNYVDTQAVAALTALAADYESVGVQLLLANCRHRVRQMLDDGGFIENIGSERLFVTVHDAVRYTQDIICAASPVHDGRSPRTPSSPTISEMGVTISSL